MNLKNVRLESILTFLLVIMVWILMSKSCSSEKELESTKAMYEAANKETIFYKDKYGRQVALSQVIQSQSTEDFTSATFTDPTVKKLQGIVKEHSSKIGNSGSATVIETEGEVHKTTKTEYIDNGACPIYKSNFSDKWISYDIVATEDTTKLNFKYLDSYSIVVGSTKDSTKNFISRQFSKKTPYAWVLSESPYSKVAATKTYKVELPKPGRVSLGLVGGYGLTTTGPGAFVGIGLSYRLFTIGN